MGRDAQGGGRGVVKNSMNSGSAPHRRQFLKAARYLPYLPRLDSNQDKESQNLLCYRYTTGYRDLFMWGKLLACPFLRERAATCFTIHEQASSLLHVTRRHSGSDGPRTRVAPIGPPDRPTPG